MKNKVLSKFRRIGIIAGKPNLDTAKIIFALQHLTHPVNGGKKSQINIFSPKEMESSSFQKKFENPELLTIGIPQNKTGRNINSITELLERMDEKEKDITVLILADMENPTAPGTWEFLSGKTLGNLLMDFKANGQNQIDYQKKFTDIVLPRLSSFIDAADDFQRNSSEKGIWADKDLLSFATIKSEMDNSLIRAVSKADITLHRRDEKSGNFISNSPKAEKYMTAVLDALNKEEYKRNPTSARKFWSRHYGVIHSDLGKISEIKFVEITDIIENTLRVFKTASGNAMATEAKHYVAPHDSAMAGPPVVTLLEREPSFESTSQVA